MASKGLSRLALVAAAAALVGACGGNAWERVAADGPSARGFAAHACDADGALFVWGGALPTAALPLRLVSGGGSLNGDGWTAVPPSPLAPRARAGAVTIEGAVMIFGGHSDAFVPYSDGAVYSATSGWDELPTGPLAGRYDPILVAFDSMVFIYDGHRSSGSGGGPATDAAFLDLQTRSWQTATAPEVDSLVAVVDGELLSFGSSGAQVYNRESDAWALITSAPDWLSAPDTATVTVSGDVVIVQAPHVWRYNRAAASFEVFPAAPVAIATAAGVTDAGLVIWDESLGKLAVLPAGANEWAEFDGPDFLETRQGTAFCIASTHITVWGGWLLRETVEIASGTGASIPVSDLVRLTQ